MTRKLGYVPALDGLRAIAIALVFTHHVLLPPVSEGGILGVDLFFVLSGFLITTLLLEEWEGSGTIRFSGFYARRALRLLPALFGLLLFCLPIMARSGSEETLKTGLGVIFYAANWMRAAERGLGLLEHSWSLSIEEQFYIIWPFILFALLKVKLKRRQILVLLLAAIGASAAWRVHLSDTGASVARLYNGSDTRSDSLLIGCALSVLRGSRGSYRMLVPGDLSRFMAPGAWLLVAALVFLADYNSLWLYQWGLPLFAAACAVIIDRLLADRSALESRLLSAPPLVWLGRLSYSLYLWHYPVCRLIDRGLPGIDNSIAEVGIKTGTSLLVAYCSYRFIEKPFLRKLAHQNVPERR